MSKHALQLLLENTDHADRLRSYSGRSMYGRECLGVTTHSMGDLIADVMVAAADWTQDEPDGDRAAGDAAEAFRQMRTDSMGHDTIVYFPGVPFTDDDSSDDEEDDEDDEDEPNLGADSQNTKTLILMGR